MDCPSWCIGPRDHTRRAKEGDPRSDVHVSVLFGADLLNTRDVKAGGRPVTGSTWKAQMLAEPDVDGHRDLPTIVFETSAEVQLPDGDRVLGALIQLHLMPSEAETMAGYLMELVNAEKADGADRAGAWMT
jgi:hypothetical protein